MPAPAHVKGPAGEKTTIELPVPRQPAIGGALAKPRIVFVEERLDALHAFERLLKVDAHRWNLVFLHTFDQAFVAMDAAPADVIVASIDAGNSADIMSLERLKADHPATVRMVFGAPALRENVVRVAPLCHQYLVKPVDVLRLHERLDRALAVRDLLTEPALRAVVGDTESLPSPPPVLLELRSALEARGTSAAQVARIVEQDPALCAKLLQLANSAFFGTSRKYAAGTVVSIGDAVILLGMATVEQLALITGLFVAFEHQEEALGLAPGALRRHTTLVAEIAANLMSSRRFAEEAFMGGLLHDVGKLVLASRFPDSYRRVAPMARRRRVPLWQVEMDEYGASHATVGAYLLACWGLPRIVIEAVAYHHHPSALGRSHFDPVGGVHVAEALVQEMDAAPNDPTGDASTWLDTVYLDRTGVLGRIGVFREIARDVAQRT
jgi:putative nucleotidyltransferase with HDIG domain